jgi:aryl-alcohol dehydrogenase-like predicted oxidoreductase
MQYRKFGNTDLKVSEIGFGAWAIGGAAMIGTTAIGWGDADDTVSVKAIHAALDTGVNFFDTADIYGLGHSEKLIGDAIGKRNDVIIATKVGNVSRNEQFGIDYSKEYILKACEASLKRLRRDSIDYYQLHTARLEQLQKGECIEAMEQLKQQGKIRYWGLSLNTFEPTEDAEFLINNSLGIGFQLVLNIINQKALPLLKQSEEKGYGIIARMPLQFGLLTGKFDNGVDFFETDHRKNRLTAEVISATLTATEPVWKLCSKYNCTKTQLALSYILSYAAVSTVIPGIRTAEQVKLNTENLFQLAADDMQLIEELGSKDFIELMQLIKKQG